MVLNPGLDGRAAAVVQRRAHEPRDAGTNGRCGFNRARYSGLPRLRIEVDLDDVTVGIREKVVCEWLGHERMDDGDVIVLHALVEVAARIDRLDEEAEVEPRRQLVRAATFEEKLKATRRSQDRRRGFLAARKYRVETKPE